MRLKKYIAQLLTVGLLLNNIYFNANANNMETLDRYETLEGEYITIDNSMEGELTEIEVFGNTVQDENNLEDIQSVGDLYVDENGNPILDSQGREQYKIDIVSANYNRLYTNEEIVDLYNNMGYSNVKAELTEDNLFKIVVNGEWLFPNKVFKGKPNTEYTFSYLTRPTCMYTNGLTLVQDHSEYVKTYRTDSTGEFGFLVSPEIGTVFDFKIYEGNVPDIDEFVEGKNKTTILLPTQLQKVGDVADRLYWDNEKGRYVIKKNIDKIVENKLDFINGFIIRHMDSTGINITYPYWGKSQIAVEHGNLSTYHISNILKGVQSKGYWATTSTATMAYPTAFHISNTYSNLGLTGLEDDTVKLERFKEYLINSINGDSITIYVKTADSNLIDTNITSKLKIPTYDNKTYVFVDSENGINPTLKVTVDRIINRAKEAIEAAKINPTVENISIARMWTNLIKDSTIKDGLQNEIGEITEVVDLAIDKKTATANLDLYVKSNNSLTMSLSTNSVTFENYSGVEDLEILDAVNITVNSSLPYSLNAYMPTPISNADGSNAMDANILNIRDNSESNYIQFVNTTDKVVLKDSCEAGDNNIHNIDLKLSGGNLHEADVYRTVLKFEAVQK